MIRVLTSVVLATALGVIVSPAPANAEPVHRRVSVEVAYSDLNPSTPSGAKALLGRMQRAAHQACGGSHGFAHLSLQIHRGACERDALARAAASIDEPMVSELIHRNDPAWQFAAR